MQAHLSQHALNIANAFQVMCEGNKAPMLTAHEADAIAAAAQTCAQMAGTLAELGPAQVLFQVLNNSRLDAPGFAALGRVANELDAATARLSPPPEPVMEEWWIQYRPTASAGWQNCTCHTSYADAHRDLSGAHRPGIYRIIGVTQS